MFQIQDYTPTMESETNAEMAIDESKNDFSEPKMNHGPGELTTDAKVQKCQEDLNSNLKNMNNCHGTLDVVPSQPNKCIATNWDDEMKKVTTNLDENDIADAVKVICDVKSPDNKENEGTTCENKTQSQVNVTDSECYEKASNLTKHKSGVSCTSVYHGSIFSVDNLISDHGTEGATVQRCQPSSPKLPSVHSLKCGNEDTGISTSNKMNSSSDGMPCLKNQPPDMHNVCVEQTTLGKCGPSVSDMSLRPLLSTCMDESPISKSLNSFGDHMNQLHYHPVTEKLCLNSQYPNLSKALSDPKIDLMQFAERLYKCTLCTTIPSILTSRSSFLQHVQEQHLNTHGCFKHCKMCSLKFHTEEDLKEHIHSFHLSKSPPATDMATDKAEAISSASHQQESKIEPEANLLDKLSDSSSLECTRSSVISSLNNLPSVRTSEILKSADALVDNESDSDSSGHRQFKTKTIKRSKPQSDFENPKQLVDHAGIETLDGSLDLTKKAMNDDLLYSSSVPVNPDRHSPRTSEVNLANVQQITEQIMKSNAAQTKSSNTQNGQKFGFVPSYTPEFGKFTKLVREGGNIVYFCQVCNWKSPVKATFQSHCSSNSHKSKVHATEDTDLNSTSEQSCKASPKMNKSLNVNVEKYTNGCKVSKEESPWPIPNGHHSVSKIPDRNSVFYNYIRQRKSQHACRTPVVSMFSNGFDNQSDFNYKHPQGHESSTISRKKKRPFSYMRNNFQKWHNSESDSDDSKTSGDQESQWKSHTSSASALLRSKILRGQCSSERQDVKHNTFDKCHQLSHNGDITLPGNKGTVLDPPNVDLSIVKTEQGDLSECIGNKMLPVLSPQKRQCTSPDDTSSKRHKNHLNDQENGPVINSCSNSYRFMPNKCAICTYEYSDVEDYEKHFAKDHSGMNGTAAPVGSFIGHSSWRDLRGGSDIRPEMLGQQDEFAMRQSTDTGSAEMGENWRVQKLKEILSEYLVANEAANVSRDYLLQCISLSSELSEVVLWSSACNKAIRELFPSSLARRKGKYKKTYYFGVMMAEPLQGQEEMTPIEVEGQQLYHARDISGDMEMIIEQLPSIVKWTGCMERGVYRGDVLAMLATRLGDRDVESWGAQCNRAIRLVYPMVDMKRKGKYKTYFGVDFKKKVKQTLMQTLDSRQTTSQCEDSVRINTSTRTDSEDQPMIGATHHPLPVSRIMSDSERMVPGMVSVYPKWFKQEAESQMGQYLARFGGVNMHDDTGGSAGDVDDDNDGDDEAGSVESSVTG